VLHVKDDSHAWTGSIVRERERERELQYIALCPLYKESNNSGLTDCKERERERRPEVNCSDSRAIWSGLKLK
jgi:hypothetical protein